MLEQEYLLEVTFAGVPAQIDLLRGLYVLR